MTRARFVAAAAASLVVGAGAYFGCTQVNSPSPAAPSGKTTPGNVIATTTTFSKCIAGNVRLDPEGSCDACYEETTTSSTIQILLGHPYGCDSFKHGVIAFDTSSLDDNATITSAKLKFNVHSVNTHNIYQAKLKIYAGNSSPCPTGLDGKQWATCADTAIDLGTIDINGTGNYEFTITSPNSVIDKSNTTIFMIEDASVPSLGASAWDTAFDLRSVAAGSAWAPALDVVN